MMYVFPKEGLPFTISKDAWTTEHHKVPNHAWVFNGRNWFFKKLDRFGGIEDKGNVPAEVHTKLLLMG
jgi:hypothetical protein